MAIVLTFLNHCWLTTLEIAPWMLLGSMLAGALHVFLPEGFIQRHLGQHRFTDIFKAVAIGVPMPLCSCGVIPAAIGLKKEGASDGASIGFLISTPQTGVDSILVSAIFLGWPFALFKVVTALLSGLIGGLLTNLMRKDHDVIETTSPKTCCNTVAKDKPAKKHFIIAILRFGIFDLLQDIYRWLIVGIAIAALISTLIPMDRLSGLWWTQGIPGLLTMLIISLPMYICATASVPLAASLVLAGMSPGAALVLLMAGPTTNVATICVILRTFGKNIVLIYLGTVIGVSLLSGYLFDGLLGQTSVTKVLHEHADPSWPAFTSAAILVAILTYLLARDLQKWHQRHKTLAE
jgi:uncharacterized membrane protein YraQ (UPF0718 family)